MERQTDLHLFLLLIQPLPSRIEKRCVSHGEERGVIPAAPTLRRMPMIAVSMPAIPRDDGRGVGTAEFPASYFRRGVGIVVNGIVVFRTSTSISTSIGAVIDVTTVQGVHHFHVDNVDFSLWNARAVVIVIIVDAVVTVIVITIVFQGRLRRRRGWRRWR